MKRKTFEDGLQSNLKLDPAKRYEIIQQSVKSDPWKLKCMICVEELAELQQALSKFLRKKPDMDNLHEEFADVMICMEWIKMYCHLELTISAL